MRLQATRTQSAFACLLQEEFKTKEGFMDEIIHTICTVIPSINWTAVILSVVYLHYGYKIIRLIVLKAQGAIEVKITDFLHLKQDKQ